MDKKEHQAYRRPSEGARLGGTLAEGRLAHNRNDQTRGIGTGQPGMINHGTIRESHGIDRSKTNVDRPSGVMRGLEALHFDHKVWLNSLRFYREELFIFQRHLEQFVRTTAVAETMAHVEQFQNRFLRQSEVIDELAHDIKEHDKALAEKAGDGPSAVIYRPFGRHNELRERMDIFERLYMELKNEFRNWLAYNR